MRALTAFALLVTLTAPASARCSCEQSPALGLVVPDSLPPPAHHYQNGPRPHQLTGGLAGAYRTLCVRVCDGYYFPISYATNRSHFNIDAAVCQSMYPPGEASLYVHRTTGEDARQAVSPETGEPLAEKRPPGETIKSPRLDERIEMKVGRTSDQDVARRAAGE